MFFQRGLFNQINCPHTRAATTRPSSAGLDIYDSVKQIYLQMVKDDNFTLKENNVIRGPRPSEKEWLLDFANATGKGDLWWYRCHATNPNLVVNFGRNFRYKWAYDPRKALLSAFHSCDSPSSLCPCCGIFGMTEEREDSSSISQGEVNSLAGKISVSPALWARGTRNLFDIDDPKILGTPKYSCRGFYLHSDAGSFNVAQDEYIRVISGNIVPNPIRGRKFYWHHTRFCDANWTERDWQNYLNRRRKSNGSRPPETDQNAKIQALLPGAQFDFTIDFENLSSPQLGLLLWTLALPDVLNGAHHLGLGKPIGMGSVVLRIRRIQLIDRKERYTSIFATGITTDVNVGSQNPNVTIDLHQAPFDDYINAFRSQMEALSGGARFTDLPNIADLRMILSRDYPQQATLPSFIVGTSSTSVPITYPLGQANAPTDVNDPHPEDLHYKWFGVKRWSERLLSIQEIALGQRQTLIPAYQQRR
jgi:CRISPR-associated protein (TIGR03986 family)